MNKQSKFSKFFYSWKGLSVILSIISIAMPAFIDSMLVKNEALLFRIGVDVICFFTFSVVFGSCVYLSYLSDKRLERWAEEEKLCICGHEKIHHRNGKCSVVIKQHQEWLSSTQGCILIELCSCTEFHFGAQKRMK